MPLDGHMRPNSLYVALDSRPLNDEYHWALVSTDTACKPTLRHASNLNGPWVHEEKLFDPDQRLMLITLVRVGDVVEVVSAGLRDVCQGVPVSDGYSARTGEPFNCRTWLMDVLLRLDEEGIIKLRGSIEMLEQAVREWAARLAEKAETGQGATIVDDTLPE